MTTTVEVDVLVIGSGAGGGTVAERLSEACPGARIAVAEKGPHYTRRHFNMREIDMTRLFKDGGAFASENFEIAVAAAECVGGSTSVYTGVTFRTPPGVVDAWARDQGLGDLSEDDVQRRFPKLEGEIDAHFPGRAMENENNRLFRVGCEALGLGVEEFRVNIKDCVGCGFCNLGCPYGAKRGTLEVQIPKAVARGVTLYPNCRIVRVSDSGADAIVSEPPPGTAPAPVSPGSVRFSAKRVVVAAGALASSALLLASDLAGLSPATGKFVTLHPAMTSMARMPREVRGFEGFPKLYFTDHFSESHHYYIETAFYFPFVTAKSLPGFGEPLRRFMSAYTRQTCALALVHDEAEERNRIRLAGERPVLDYRLSPASRAALVHAMRSAGRIFFAAGALEYVSPISNRFSVEREQDLEAAITDADLAMGRVLVSSAHPMGGCRMGSDPKSSVTDAWGRLHGHPSIFVADASLFPTSTKVNPYLTVMAFAERTAEQVARDIGSG